jgi:rod shape-determining protein MreD
MKEVRTVIALAVAVALQWSLSNVVPAMVFINFPLLVVVYVALNRESLQAMLYATVAGVAIDALSGGLLGASGFSMTLTAFAVAELSRRVLLVDNPLLKIPVTAGAAALSGLIYYSMHRLLGQTPSSPLAETLAYTAIGTAIAGTIILLTIELFFSDRAKLNRRINSQPRRNNFRRNPIRLSKRV